MKTWLGVRGEDARRGEGLAADGIFGPLTDGVTRRFQSVEGVPVDGIVGPATRAAYRSPPDLIRQDAAPSIYEPFLSVGSPGTELEFAL